MAVDISIENFALVLFRKLWIRHGLSDVINCVNNYPDIPSSETEYTDEILNTVYLQQVLSHFFYEQLLDKDYHEFSTSRSDFHSYFTSGCDHFSVAGLNIMEELLGTAAFIAEMGLVCANNQNVVFAHSCPLSWAMHFDWNLKKKFYEAGGWAAFREYSAGYEKTSTFVMSFGRQYNVYEEIEKYFDNYFPKLMNVFSKPDSEEWKRKCTALKVALNPVNDNSKGPLMNSQKFTELIRLPSLLDVLSKLLDINFLSDISTNELVSCVMTNLRCDSLENVEKTTNNDLRQSISDSKSNTSGRDESKFMGFFSSEPKEKSIATSSRPADDVSFPTYQCEEQTEANSSAHARNEIVLIPIACSASMDPNSTKKNQSDMNSKLPNSVSSPTSKKQIEENSTIDSKNEIVPLSSKPNTCSASNTVSNSTKKTEPDDQAVRNSINSMICIDYSDVSEQVLSTTNSAFRSSAGDSKTNTSGRDESNYINLFFQPDVKSIGGNMHSQTSQCIEQTEENFGTDSKNKIVSLSSQPKTCSASNIVPNSTKEIQLQCDKESKSLSAKLVDIESSPTNQSENQSKVNSVTDSINIAISLSSMSITCSASEMVLNSTKKTHPEDQSDRNSMNGKGSDYTNVSQQIETFTNSYFPFSAGDFKLCSFGRDESQFMNLFLKSNERSKATNTQLADCDPSQTSHCKEQTKDNIGSGSMDDIVTLSSETNACSGSNIVPTASSFTLNDLNQNKIKQENEVPDLSKASELIQSIDHITRLVNVQLSLNDPGELTSSKSTCSTIESSCSRPKDLKQNGVKRENKDPDPPNPSELIQSIDHITRLVNEHLSRNDYGELTAPKPSSSTVETSYLRPNDLKQNGIKRENKELDPSKAAELIQSIDHITRLVNEHLSQNDQDELTTNFFNQTPSEHAKENKTTSKRRKRNKGKKNKPSHESKARIFENPSTTADLDKDGYGTDPAPANISNQVKLPAAPCAHVTEAKPPSKSRKRNKGIKNESSHESKVGVFENLISATDEDGYSTEPAPADFSYQMSCEHVTESQTPSKRREKNKSKMNEPLQESETNAFENPSTTTDTDGDGKGIDSCPDNSSNQMPFEQVSQTKSPIKEPKENKSKMNEALQESETNVLENPSTATDGDGKGIDSCLDNSSNQKSFEQITRTKSPTKRPKKNKSKMNEPLHDSEPSIFEKQSTETNLDAPYTQEQIRELILQMLLVLGTGL